jgi:ABC-type branched-subunit amino acid transport system substrate-binding protein
MRNRLLPVRSRIRTSIMLALCGTAAAAAMTVTATALASSSKTAACTGPTFKVGAITNISNPAGSQQTPELPAGLKAAAAALTKSCELGGPVQVHLCDDKFNPNDAAACGRDMVSYHPAVVFTYSGFGDSYFPAVTAAGIPIIPINATSQEENTSPNSYPLGFPIASLIGQVSLCADIGRTKLALPVLDIPSVTFLVGIADKAAKAFGVTIKEIPVPLTATDMSGFAGQAIAAGANCAVTVIGPAQLVGFFQGIRQQGATPKQIAFVGSTLTLTAPARAALGSAVHGMILAAWAWNTADTSRPSVVQEIREWKAAKQPTGLLDTLVGPSAWGGLHMVADALKAARLAPTAANIPRALKQKSVFKLSAKYGLNPLDYSQPAFATDPVLKSLRIFSRYMSVFQVNNAGKVLPVSKAWVGVLHKTKLSLPVPIG